MKPLQAMLPYLVVIAADFYLLPLLIRNTGWAMLLLLVVIPLVCLACSVVYGWRYSFHGLYPVIVAVLFMPTIFLFYNSTAWVYIVAYGIIALLGNLIGMVFFKVGKALPPGRRSG